MVDVVGPVCESGDRFAADLALAPAQAGDLLAIRSAGAYGAAMASTYNSRDLVPEVLVRGAAFGVIRRPMTIETALDHETLPTWLATS